LIYYLTIPQGYDPMIYVLKYILTAMWIYFRFNLYVHRITFI
jgi:hypothetical protein